MIKKLNTGMGLLRLLRGLAMTMCALYFLSATICPGYCQSPPVAYLSLSDVLNIAIHNNLDIRLAKLDNWIKSTELLYSQAIFDTTITGEASYTDDRRERSSIIAGSKTIQAYYMAGLEKKLPTGATFSTTYSNTRDWSDSEFITVNPSHTAEWSLSVSQPVLRNFFGMQDWGAIVMTRIDVRNSDINTLDRIEQSLADVEKQYWKVAFAYRNLEIEKSMLEKAKRLLEVNQRHLQTGLIEKGDLLGSEANVRIRENGVLITENKLTDAINQLKLILNEPFESIAIEPLDELELTDEAVSFPESLKYAFMSRRDYKIKRNELRNKKINLKLKRNSLWPEIDLVGSLAMNGVDRKPEKAIRTTAITKFPKYYAGVKVSMSLDNNQARSEYNAAKYEKIKAITELQKLERSIITEIDEKVREVLMQHERARKDIAIRKIQELKLKEEEKRFKYGRSSNKIIIDYQHDLLKAEHGEALATLDFQIALVELKRAQNKILEKAGIVKP